MSQEVVEYLERDYDAVFRMYRIPPVDRCFPECTCHYCEKPRYFNYRARMVAGLGRGPSCERDMFDVLDKDMCNATDETCCCYGLPSQPLASVPEPTEKELHDFVFGNWYPDLYRYTDPERGISMVHVHSEWHDARRERVARRQYRDLSAAA